MDIDEIRGHGRHLAICASIRILAAQIAQILDPRDQARAFIVLSETTFGYIDRTRHPDFDEPTIRQIKELAHETLRMIFDPKGI